MEIFTVNYKITRDNRDVVVGRENANRLFNLVVNEGAVYARICSTYTDADGIIVDGSVVRDFVREESEHEYKEESLPAEMDFAEYVAMHMGRC